mgnify:CR=1 FL=1
MAAPYKPSSALSHSPDAPSPLPEKIGLILQESRWLALVALAGFLGLALWGFDRHDPGWSHAVSGATLHNPAGRGGAWLADLLLYGQNVVPQRLLDAGFHFRHPDLAPALRHLFKESKSHISVAEI